MEVNFFSAIGSLLPWNKKEVADENPDVEVSTVTGVGTKTEITGAVKNYAMDVTNEETLIKAEVVEDEGGTRLVEIHKTNPVEMFFNGLFQRFIVKETALDTTANASIITDEQKEESGIALYGAYFDAASREKVNKPVNDTISATGGKTFADIVKENYGISSDDTQINAYYGQILEANRDNINWNTHSDIEVNTSFQSTKSLTSLNIPPSTQVAVNGEAMTFEELKNNISKYEKIEGLLDNLNVSFDLKDAANIDLTQFADKNGKVLIDGQEHDANNIDKAQMFGRQRVVINGVEYNLENEIDYAALKDVDVSSLFKGDEIELPDVAQEGGTTSSLKKTDETRFDYNNYPQNIELQEGESLPAAIARIYQVQEGSLVANYLLSQVVADKGNDKLFKSTGIERLENALELSENGNLAGKTINLPQQDMVFEIYSRKTFEKPQGANLNDVVEDDETKYFNFLRNDQNLSTDELSALNEKIQENQKSMVNYGVVKNQLLENHNSEAITLLDELQQEKGSSFTKNELQTFLQNKRENGGDDNKINQILTAYNESTQKYANKEVMDYALGQYFAPNSTNSLATKLNDGYRYSECVAVVKKAIIENNPDVFNSDGSLKFSYENSLSQIKNIVIPDVIYNFNEKIIVESSSSGGNSPTPPAPCDPEPPTIPDYT